MPVVTFTRSGSRDRRDRGRRGPLAWPRVPAMRTRRDAFDDVVLDCADRVRPHLGQRYDHVEFAVEDVPSTDPAPWEEQSAALGRLVAGHGGVPPRIVVHRRPIEARATDPADLAQLVQEVVVEQVAALLGVPPGEIEP